jgi:serine/threonine-protein kinase
MLIKKVSIKNPIKEGGQKDVYLAEDEIHGNVIYKKSKISNSCDVERIHRELDCLQSLTYSCFPKVYEFNIIPATNEFEIIEEFLDGGSLTNQLTKTWDENSVVELLKKLIIPVSILWENNIVHRDIKPDNIMFRKNGELVLIDLGIARFLNDDSLTPTMNFIGPCTPPYAAPEQLINNKRYIDFRTDQFAMGITLLELFLGHHPFDPAKLPSSKGNIAMNILSGIYVQPMSVKTCSPAFQILIQKLLKPRQYQRFNKKSEIDTFISQNWS